MFFSIMSKKMESMHLWKVADALHSPKGILLVIAIFGCQVIN